MFLSCRHLPSLHSSKYTLTIWSGPSPTRNSEKPETEKYCHFEEFIIIHHFTFNMLRIGTVLSLLRNQTWSSYSKTPPMFLLSNSVWTVFVILRDFLNFERFIFSDMIVLPPPYLGIFFIFLSFTDGLKLFQLILFPRTFHQYMDLGYLLKTQS